MNPSQNSNPTQNQNPFPTQPTAPSPARGGGHIALTIILIILILLSFGFVGWKWFANQKDLRVLEAQNAAMRAEFERSAGLSMPAADATSSGLNEVRPGQAAVSRSIQGADALDYDMALILNSSSEDDLKSIDKEF